MTPLLSTSPTLELSLSTPLLKLALNMSPIGVVFLNTHLWIKTSYLLILLNSNPNFQGDYIDQDLKLSSKILWEVKRCQEKNMMSLFLWRKEKRGPFYKSRIRKDGIRACKRRRCVNVRDSQYKIYILKNV